MADADGPLAAARADEPLSAVQADGPLAAARADGPIAAARAAGPIEPAEADALFSRLTRFSRLALAVSGGADSSALLTLVAEWRMRLPRPPAVTVLTVDHGLRAEARDEAEAVVTRAAALGLEAVILRWTGEKPAANLQDAARRARYRLLVAAARRHGAEALVTAHTRDDQAETFLLNLARGSGVYGLAAMPAERPLGPVTLVRPFLAVARARLVASLRARGLAWVEDPSNRDERFRRVAVRRRLAALGALGLGPERLAATAHRMARAAAAIDQAVDRFLDAHALEHPAGFARLDAAAWTAEAEEIRLRALARLIAHAGGGDHAPRLARLERLAAAIAAAGPARLRRTLAGALVERRGDAVWLLREPGRSGLPRLMLAPGRSGPWDGRFLATLAADAPGPVEIAALGGAARAFAGPAPAFALAAAPAAWADGRLVAVPALGHAAPGWGAAVRIEPVPPGEAWLLAEDGTDVVHFRALHDPVAHVRKEPTADSGSNVSVMDGRA